MHATIQSGGRSPKPINGPAPMPQLKAGSDTSQAKGRKRERVDLGSDPIKRDRSSKADDCDSVQFRSESALNLEVSRITENGGLVDSEGVEKLVQLMQSNRVEKKLELVSKSIFAGVVAATENFDCLSRFVQLKGLPVLDQWLQDIHKGKLGGDKSIEDFLFILLRALDKLPVNLQALQMCNIGKSVNHLRTYKNTEIQKKARSLVDTWKKRVEAEMNVIDTKSSLNRAVSWPSRSHLPEGSSGKIASTKPVQAEMSAKLATSLPASVKDGEQRSVVGSNPDLPSTIIKDERSSSSQSRSCSSDNAKTTGLSGKEDTRSSTAGSISANKVTSGSSRPQRAVTRINLASEKLTCEKAIDIPITEGSNPKLIVKLPNRGHSPVQNASASSPVPSEKNDQSDPDSKEEEADVKTESWESNDFKEILTGSDEGDVSPDELKSEKLHDVSFSSINALIESCVKYSQVNTTDSGGDDGGMNLLASVAAGEISKSNLSSPDGSSGRNSNIQDESNKGDNCKLSESDVRVSTIPEQIKEEETNDVAAIVASPISKQREEKAETKEVSKLKENSLSRDKVDEVASHLEVKKEASVGDPSTASLDATIENKADGGEEFNFPSKDVLFKSVEKIDGVKLEYKETGKFDGAAKESELSVTNAAAETLHVNKKPKFDLNEGFSSDDGKLGDIMSFENSGYSISARMVNTLPFPAPITVAAAAKGPFVPPIDLLRSKRELGWKGSAATSAFRPAEPRKALEFPPVTVKTPDRRPVLDFDLNVADELMLDDVASRYSPQETASTSGHATIHDFSLKKPLLGIDLDLNRVDDVGDMWQGSTSSGRGMEVPFFPAKKGFDLNDGPVVDEPSEPSLRNPQNRSNIQSQPFFTSQTATNGPFPIVATNGPFPRVLGPPIPFGPELYRGSVPFPSFQYPVFPFGNGFPLPSASLSGVSNAYTDSFSNGRLGFSGSNLQLLSAPPSVASHFPRPYLVGVSDGSNSGNPSKWARQGLDLNAGPGSVDMEAKDESSPLVSMTGGVSRRNENTENFRYRQPSRQ